MQWEEEGPALAPEEEEEEAEEEGPATSMGSSGWHIWARSCRDTVRETTRKDDRSFLLFTWPDTWPGTWPHLEELEGPDGGLVGGEGGGGGGAVGVPTVHLVR